MKDRRHREDPVRQPPEPGREPAPKPAGTRRRTVPRKEIWQLRLYIAGMTPRATAALENLKAICEEKLPGVYEIEVVDLLVNPALARGDQILAVPTLVRKLPPPLKKIIGDLSNSERVLVGLDLKEPRGR